MRLSIRQRLLLSFGFLLLLMLALGGIALVQMGEMRDRALNIKQVVIPTLNTASDMRRVANRYRMLQAALLIAPDAPTATRLRADLATQEQSMADLFRAYEPLIVADGERAEYGQFRSTWEQFVERVNADLIPHQRAGRQAEAALDFAALSGTFDSLVSTSARLRTIDEAQGDAALAAEESSFAGARLTMLIFTLALAVGASVLGVALSSAIAGNIGRLTAAAADVAAGNLGREVEVRSTDETGALARQFNQMVASLRAARAVEAQARAEEERRNEEERRARALLQQAVNTYSAFIARVAAGNLTSRVAPEGDDELRRLGDGLNAMVEGLHRITSQVQQANTSIASAAAEILAATTQQATAAAEQSAVITQTTATIDEVKAIALETARRAAQVAQDSQGALGVARQGTASVEETVAGMTHIRGRVETIAQRILGLAEQTQAIGGIITTVSELADQSNLLALNAAIEAARAGEQGKSFAVVAQHVRDLAERSKGATVQVREILSEIQKATNSAVLVTEEGTKGVEVGTRLATQAGQVIHRIAGEVEEGAQANVQMAAAAQQQTAGMEQIGQAMESIQQATTQTLASTRQAERAAQDLHTLAQSLQRAIATYQL